MTDARGGDPVFSFMMAGMLAATQREKTERLLGDVPGTLARGESLGPLFPSRLGRNSFKLIGAGLNMCRGII